MLQIVLPRLPSTHWVQFFSATASTAGQIIPQKHPLQGENPDYHRIGPPMFTQKRQLPSFIRPYHLAIIPCRSSPSLRLKNKRENMSSGHFSGLKVPHLMEKICPSWKPLYFGKIKLLSNYRHLTLLHSLAYILPLVLTSEHQSNHDSVGGFEWTVRCLR